MAMASSYLSGAWSEPDATPAARMCPGMTVRSVVPSDAMRSFTDCWAPFPSATIVITAATPITMPSMVRNERSLFARSASSATAMVSPSSMRSPSPGPAATTTTGGTPRASAHAGRHAAHALTQVAEVLVPLGLELRDAQERDLVPLLHAVEHLRVVVIGHAQPHDARLESLRRVHEDDLELAPSV